MTLPRTEMKEQAELDKQTVREILGLQEMWVIFGSAPRGGDEIAVIGRSMLEMLIHIGASVDVPSSHVAEGRTYETRTFDTDAPPAAFAP